MSPISRTRKTSRPSLRPSIMPLILKGLETLRRRSSLTRIPDDLLKDVLCDDRLRELEEARRRQSTRDLNPFR